MQPGNAASGRLRKQHTLRIALGQRAGGIDFTWNGLYSNASFAARMRQNVRHFGVLTYSKQISCRQRPAEVFPLELVELKILPPYNPAKSAGPE